MHGDARALQKVSGFAHSYNVRMTPPRPMRFLGAWIPFVALSAAEYRPPAGTRPATIRPGSMAILPGGRAVLPLGRHHRTGPGTFGLAVNAKSTIVVTANGGPNRYSLTVVSKSKEGWNTDHLIAPKNKEEEADGDEKDWRSIFMGLAFEDDNSIFASEGESGRVRVVDTRSAKLRRVYELNQGGFRDSYSGDLAYDAATRRLYVLDQANFRLVIFDAPSRRVLSTLKVGRLPFSISLAPDGKRVYVAHIGMFEYQAVPGADAKNARATGLEFPAFGFPSPESRGGVTRRNASGAEVAVPALGDPNSELSNSVAAVDVSNPAEPRVLKYIRTGRAFGAGGVVGGSSPSAVLATATQVYVANGHNDSISIIDAATLDVTYEIPLRLQGLDGYRGFLPVGLHYDAATKWLLVACAGINAIAVIDTAAAGHKPIGMLPTAWFPTRVAVKDGTVWVGCAKGLGTGPNGSRAGRVGGNFADQIRQGLLLSFALPGAEELPKHTATVFQANGFVPQGQAEFLPAGIEHVAIILKENRTFDEVFGDIEEAANGKVIGLPSLARLGRYGVLNSRRGEFQQRLGFRNISVTPNHHALARRFAFSDNFYADSEVSVDGHHWIVGSYPSAWTETSLMAAYGGQKNFRLPTTAPGRLLFAQSNSSVHPEEQLEAGALWHHLDRHKITFRNFGEGYELAGADEGTGLKPTGARYLTNVPMPEPLYRNSSRAYPNYNMNIPDQFRATQFIKEVHELYVRPGKPLPRLLFIHLPNDHMAKARPEDGYPYTESFVADNDYALGRVVDYLSHSKWWPKMAIFVTEDDAQGGIDHIDSHRTVLLTVSPYARRNFVSHVNSSFPGLLKTVFRLLRIPPLNLFDATAADLSNMFQPEPDLEPYTLVPVPAEAFDPAKAKEPMDPEPSPRMDDPRVIRQQQREIPKPPARVR